MLWTSTRPSGEATPGGRAARGPWDEVGEEAEGGMVPEQAHQEARYGVFVSSLRSGRRDGSRGRRPQDCQVVVEQWTSVTLMLTSTTSRPIECPRLLDDVAADGVRDLDDGDTACSTTTVTSTAAWVSPLRTLMPPATLV